MIILNSASANRNMGIIIKYNNINKIIKINKMLFKKNAASSYFTKKNWSSSLLANNHIAS